MRKLHSNSMLMPSTNTGQRGAALLAVLLMATLLLAVGGALISTTQMSTANAIDSTAEMQAYYAAEAGLQATLNVLRGNAPPLDGSTTKMNFRNAIDPAKANKAGDSANGSSRLSNWLSYSADDVDRVTLSGNYTKFSGLAYKVSISDPDATASENVAVDPAYRPKRLQLQVTGFGPRGAIKTMQVMAAADNLNFNIPSVVTLLSGPNDALKADIGKDTGQRYSGLDNCNPSAPAIPIFGTAASDQAEMESEIIEKNAIKNGTVETTPHTVALNASNLPSFLQDADAARAWLNKMEALAKSSNRYFSDGSLIGDPSGFTFLDAKGGDAAIDGGSGLLIVIGSLKMNEVRPFNGIVLVFGGKFERKGATSIYGASMAVNLDRATPGLPFGKLEYKVGGCPDAANDSTCSRQQYDSCAINDAFAAVPVGLKIKGVVER